MPIRPSPLPTWFVLNKYEKLRQLSLADWLVELDVRRHDFWVLTHLTDENDDDRELREEARRTWELIRREGVISPHLREQVQQAGEAGPGDHTYLAIVTSLTVGDLSLGLHEGQHVSELVDTLISDNQVLNMGATDDQLREVALIGWDVPLDKFAGSDERKYLSIDISAPDDVIVREFMGWLKDQRQSSKPHLTLPPKQFDEQDMASWIKHQVLPYLDLQFAAEMKEWSPTNWAIGDALFPDDDFDPSEKVRKTVAPLAKRLMSKRFLRAIERQVSAGQSSRAT